jgi:hypothetical protein
MKLKKHEVIGGHSAVRMLVGTFCFLVGAVGCTRSITVGEDDNRNTHEWEGGADSGAGADAGPGPDASRPNGWNPPIDNLGEPGWRQSTEPWEPGEYDLRRPSSVWSDQAGVYAMLAGFLSHPWNGNIMYHLILSNDGTGWQVWLDFPLMVEPDWREPSGKIRGFPDRDLIAFGKFGTDDPGPIVQLSASGPGQVTPVEVTDVFIVHDQLAYAAAADKVIRYDGSHWEPIPSALPHFVRRVWANEHAVVAVGDVGTIVSLENDQWVIHDSHTVDDLTAIWGFTSNDIWVGAANGNLNHYDGSGWSGVSWPNPQPANRREPIVGMWGKNGTLFFHSEHMLVRTDGQSFDVLADWGCDMTPDQGSCHWTLAIDDIWGNSPSELFLAVAEDICQEFTCDTFPYLLWFDGAEFHWF